MNRRSRQEAARRAARLASWCLAMGLLPLALASCSTPIDLKQSLEITDIRSGWFDAGIVAGKNKLVPSVTFRVRKKTDSTVRVAVNVVFRRVPAPGATAEEDWDEVYVQSVEFGSDNQTKPMTVRANTGYTGDPPQTRLEMLKHSQFRDMRAHVFLKHSSSQWVELATIDVQRLLLTQ